jgi:hypothetical protein
MKTMTSHIEMPAIDSIPDIEAYASEQARIRREQEGMTKEEVMAKLAAENESVVDLDSLTQTHHWIDRGNIMSCEGANHPNHRHRKVRR